MDEAEADVRTYLEGVVPARRRRDAETLLGLMAGATGLSPRLWGSIVGFGGYHYRYGSGREGDAPAAAFALRKAATVVYLADGVGAHAHRLERLGSHTTGVGCLYLKDLELVDLEVLRTIVETSFRTVTRGTYGKQARAGHPDEPS